MGISKSMFGPDGLEPVMLVTPDIDVDAPVLVRVHSECFTGDVTASLRCDCGDQRDLSLRLIGESGNGAFLYLRQEGRGIGLYEKIKSYRLQEQGHDIHEANLILGHPPDDRDYGFAKTMLDEIRVSRLRLLTNNPDKISALSGLGFTVTDRIPLITEPNPHNHKYLETKIRKFGHHLGKNEKQHRYFGVSGVSRVADLEKIIKIADNMTNTAEWIFCGVPVNAALMEEEDSVTQVNEMLDAVVLNSKIKLVLHYSLRDSLSPLRDLEKAFRLLPAVQFLQLNDINEDHEELLKRAVAGHRQIIFPLSDSTFSLVDRPSFAGVVRENKVWLLIDNSKGLGRVENPLNYINKIRHLLNLNIDRIALAGGFGPDDLENYRFIQRFFKLGFSVDAESGLKSGGNMDFSKVQRYLEALGSGDLILPGALALPK